MAKDLSFVREQSYPFQQRVAAHLVQRIAQVDAAIAAGDDALATLLKTVVDEERYVLTVADDQNAFNSRQCAARITLYWVEALIVGKANEHAASLYDNADSAVWKFINDVLTSSHVARLAGIPDPDPSETSPIGPEQEPPGPAQVSADQKNSE